MVRGLGKGTTYVLSHLLGRHILWATQRVQSIRPDMPERDGPLIIALTHLSHLDPILLSVMVRQRPIDWMARREFFHYRPIASYMKSIGAICVRRHGVASNAVRAAMDRLRKGRVIGVCPEGGVAQGNDSIVRGASMKQGICLISIRSGVPVLPCVMLGTDRLNCVPPWIPFRRSQLFVAYGKELVRPPVLALDASRDQRRAARCAMAEELSRQFQFLFRESLETFGLPESFVP